MTRKMSEAKRVKEYNRISRHFYKEIGLLKKHRPKQFKNAILVSPYTTYVYGVEIPMVGEETPGGFFAYRADTSITNGVRFDTGRGTVFDLLSFGLWEQNPTTEEMSFQEASEYAASLSVGDVTDWGLPSPIELGRLVEKGVKPPLIDKKLFPTCDGGLYWTNCRDRYPLAICVNFDTVNAWRLSPFYKFHVRCFKKALPRELQIDEPFYLESTPEEDARFMEAISICN